MVLKPLTNFPLRAEEYTSSPKQATKCKFYSYQLFSQTVALDNWKAPLTTLRKPFRWKSDVSVQWSTFFIQIFLLPEKFLKKIICTCRLRFWESCLSVLLKVHVFSAQSPKLYKENKFSRLYFPFISLCTMIGGLGHLTKQFCKKTKKSLKLQRW